MYSLVGVVTLKLSVEDDIPGVASISLKRRGACERTNPCINYENKKREKPGNECAFSVSCDTEY